MAIQLSTTLRNNMVGQYETTIGTAPKLQIRSGAQPATCATADSGTLLAELTLPSDWMGAASAGAIALGGTWSGTGAAAGTAAHYRLKDSAGTTCHEQGSVTATGGGGDLTLDNTSIASSQAVSVTSWTRTQGGA
jgi:hypothetical protein